MINAKNNFEKKTLSFLLFIHQPHSKNMPSALSICLPHYSHGELRIFHMLKRKEELVSCKELRKLIFPNSQVYADANVSYF